MSGIFGAGVATRLQELNFYNKIEAIYGTSAGVMNGAYFLTRQSELGSSIYYEDLIKNFLFPTNIPYGSFQRIWNGYIHKIQKRKIIDAIDIDYIVKIIKNKKILDVDRLKKQDIPLYAKLLNFNTNKINYFDVREKDTLKILKAAISMVPYWFFPQRINNQKYADGSIKEPIGLRYLLEKYPDYKIIIVLNTSIIRTFKSYVTNFLEAVVARSIYRPLFKNFINRENSIRNDIKLAAKHKRVLIIHLPKDNPMAVYTTNPSKLIKTYKMGKIEAEKIKAFSS